MLTPDRVYLYCVKSIIKQQLTASNIIDSLLIVISVIKFIDLVYNNLKL